MAITGSQPAYMDAMAGVMRAGTSRANVHSMDTFVAIAGVQVATARAVEGQQVDNETLTITENDADTPNTASFKVRGFIPSDGQDVLVTQGSINNLERLFAGTILRDTSGYTGTPANLNDQVSVIDYTWQLTRETITQRWTNVSATVIAQAILAHAGRGFTSRRVEADLPIVDEFTVTNQTHMAALQALAQRLGATVKPTYDKDVKFRITPDALHETDPTPLTAASALLTETTDVSVTRDLGQVITRQPVEGGGSTALTEVAPGETILPLAEIAWYNAAGGTVVSGPQHLTYTGRQVGGGGTLVGPGMGPTVAPTLARQAGSGVESGAHSYAVVFVTAAGKSLPSPLATISLPGTAGSSSPIFIIEGHNGGGTQPPGGYRNYAWTTVDASGLESAASARTGASTVTFADGVENTWSMTVPVGPAGTVSRNIYRTAVAASGAASVAAPLQYLTTIPDNVTTAFGDHVTTDANLGATVPLEGNQVALSTLAIGPAGVTAREIYRTAAGAAQLKLQQTIADNTATTATDATADGSLGANAPTSDTSALAQPAGQVLAGSSSIIVAGGTAGFAASGGWARLGSGQAVRYTGLSGNTLTGIPASGPGAIAATISYNTTILAAPALTGIPASGDGSILYTIRQGDPVNLRVVVEDLAAQAAIAALVGGGDDGVIEGALIQDGRISETEARARGQAVINLRKALDVGVTLTTHDRNVHASRPLAVNLTQPACVGTFKLQTVTLSHFHPSRWPLRQASAGQRFTLEDLLREARQTP